MKEFLAFIFQDANLHGLKGGGHGLDPLGESTEFIIGVKGGGDLEISLGDLLNLGSDVGDAGDDAGGEPIGDGTDDEGGGETGDEW